MERLVRVFDGREPTVAVSRRPFCVAVRNTLSRTHVLTSKPDVQVFPWMHYETSLGNGPKSAVRVGGLITVIMRG